MGARCTRGKSKGQLKRWMEEPKLGVSVFDSILLPQLWGTEVLYAVFSGEGKV